MVGKRVGIGIVLVALAIGVYVGVKAYIQHRTDIREEAEMASFRSDWSFDPNDPKLLEARFLATDGIALVTLGFPTIITLGDLQVVQFVSASATFLDMEAQQIHMASKPDATLADVPLGSMVKVRAGADGETPGNYVIYDILVVE